ncbi:MAG: radical SAM protein [Acidimicrobiales bacterium]
MTRKYLVRTYGCQMNEHDSERIAGLLEADGLEPATGLDDADVVVLNTCCIRENADNKLYGQLGHLKAHKQQRPDLEILVGGCLAQKDRELVRERAPHVDVVFGTHNVHRVTDLLAEARDGGARTEIWDEAADDEVAFASALPARREVDHAAWVTIQVGCDNTCAFCIVPSVRGRESSRPFGEIVAEVEGLAADGVTEVTLLGQNVNSYGRDLTTAYAAQRRPRSTSRPPAWPGRRAAPGPAAVRRPARGGRHRRRHPPFATRARTPRTCDRRPSPPWPLSPRCAPTCTRRCRPGRTRCSPPCTAATPPSATSSGSPPRRRRRPRRHHRPDRRLPR